MWAKSQHMHTVIAKKTYNNECDNDHVGEEDQAAEDRKLAHLGVPAYIHPDTCIHGYIHACMHKYKHTYMHT